MTRGITVVVPTVGRDSLDVCLRSFASQLNAEDAVVVVSDGSRGHVRDLVRFYSAQYPWPDWTYVGIEQRGCWGHPAANYALGDGLIKTSHVWRLDDDDEADSGALAAMRQHLDDSWTVLKMTFGAGHHAAGVTCWREPVLRHGDIGTPMILAQHCEARFGLEYSGDWVYAQQLQAMFGEPVWDEYVVATIKP